MAKRITNRILHHTNDTGFREWVAAFISDLEFGGTLVRTADTGQIDGGVSGGTITATRPSLGAFATAPAIFRFNDSLQSTSPYFFRFEFGTGATDARPAIRWAVGTGTNGSGTLINPSAAIVHNTVNNASNTTTGFNSYVCSQPGSIALGFGIDSGFFHIGLHRVRNPAGVQTGEGLVYYVNTNSSIHIHNSINSAAAGLLPAVSTNNALSPGLPTASVHSGTPRCYRHFTGNQFTGVRPVQEYVSVIRAEVPIGSIFDSRPVGLTPRTYIALPGNTGAISGGSGNYALAMMWD